MKKEFYLTLHDNIRIYVRSEIFNAGGKHILIHHGLGEHCGRYENLKKFLSGAGCNVHSFDARGHGKSDGRRGDAPGIAQFSEDLREVLLMLHAEYRQPFILYGHSMGAMIVLDYALRYPQHLTAVAAASSGLSVTMDTFMLLKKAMGRLIGRFFPALTLNTGLSAKHLSHDPSVIAQYRSDPLVHGKISARLGLSLLEYGSEVIARAPKLKLPVFLAHGADDHLTNPQGTVRFYENVLHPRKKLFIYPGMKHELHNELPELRERYFSDLAEWLKSPVQDESRTTE